jgi:hypothetical protein
MKTVRILAAMSLITLLFGCQSAPSGASLIERVLNAALPETHNGPAKFSHANQYFTIDVEAEGLKKENGRWVYTWLTYERKSHFPIFSGVTWASTGKVTLGTRPAL